MKYCRAVSFEEIAENDYNLNIVRYIDTFEGYENVDLRISKAGLKKLQIERVKLESEAEIIFDKIVI